MKLLYAVFIAAIFLSGCATYSAVGTFDRYNEVFVGEVNHNLMSGGGTFKMSGMKSGIHCEGNAVLVQSGLSCQGQWGEIFAECSDGRSIMGKWRAITCTTGYGIGKDSLGSEFTFTFGGDKEEAIRKAEHKLKTREGFPSTPSYSIKE